MGKTAKILSIGLALILISLVLGVLIWRPGWGRHTIFTDAATIAQPADEARLRDILWRPPEALPPRIDTPEDEYEPALSPDGLTLIFVRGKAGQNADLYSSQRSPEGWSPPTPLTAINTDADELGPEISLTGDSLYFYSNRPGGEGGYDLWVSRRGDEEWKAPVNLGPAVNSPFNDYGPALAPDGATLYFSSNRPQTKDHLTPIPDPESWPATVREDLFTRDYDIYAALIANGKIGAPVSVAALNSPYHEGAPAISPVGDFLYFSSTRPGGEGGFDLYRVRKFPDSVKGSALISGGPFGEVENLGSTLNTAANELDPDLGMGGFRLHFSSDRAASATPGSVLPNSDDYDIYFSTSREVFAETELVRADIDWMGLWGQLKQPLFWLLLALLALLLLLLLWRLAREDRLGRLGLIARCLIVSVLAHVLALVLLTFWMVGSSLSNWMHEGRGTRVLLLSSSVGEGVARQVRGDLTQVAVPIFEISESTPTEESTTEPLPIETKTLTVSRAVINESTPLLEHSATLSEPNLPKPLDDHALSETEPNRDANVILPPRLTPVRVVESEAIPPSSNIESTAKTLTVENSSSEIPTPESRINTVRQITSARDQEPLHSPLLPPSSSPLPPHPPTPATIVALPFTPDIPRLPVGEITVIRQNESTLQVDEVRIRALPIDTRSLTGVDSKSPGAVAFSPLRYQNELDIPLVKQFPDQTPTESPLPTHAISSDESPVIPRLEIAFDLAPLPAGDAPPPSESALTWSSETWPESVPRRETIRTPTLEAQGILDDLSTLPPIDIPDQRLTASSLEGSFVSLPVATVPPEEALFLENPSRITLTHPEEAATQPNQESDLRIALPDHEAPSPIWNTEELLTEYEKSAAVILAPSKEKFPDKPLTLIPSPNISLRAINPTKLDVVPADDLPLIPPPSGILSQEPREEMPTSRLVEAPSPPPDVNRLNEYTTNHPFATDEPPLQIQTPESVRFDPPRMARAEPRFLLHDNSHFMESLSPDETIIPRSFDQLADLPAPDPFDLTLPAQTHAPPNPYDQRAPERRRELVDEMGGSAETEKAVADALDWLARHQQENGSWDGIRFDDECGQCEGRARINVRVALTGLSLLAFLAADHTPAKDGPYRVTVTKGIDWLLAHQDEDGSLLGEETMYSHGIASIALAEAYGMTGDKLYKDPVQRAINFIYAARNKRIGGWRYGPGEVGDTSVLGWQIMALESARRAGLEVPEEAFTVARDWIKLVEHPRRRGLYAYQPRRPVSPAMTAEGMFVNQLLGVPPAHEPMQTAADYILRHPPDWDAGPNTYYWYYATMALFQHHPDAWNQWNEAIKEALLPHQHREGRAAGSWNPEGQWAKVGGRVYQTAICALTLEVYYRYLPRFMQNKYAGSN